jgi:hypothetical protein
MNEMIRPQADFPLMEEYKKQFDITDRTVFALGVDIYTNHELTPDLLIHELTHLRQQEEVGVKEWVYDFLYTPSTRLKYEAEAYREQLKSIKDRNHKNRVWLESARNLSSSLYGNIISFEEAKKLLKV